MTTRRSIQLIGACTLLLTGTVIGTAGQHFAGASPGGTAATLNSIEPCRLVDTRPPPNNIGPRRVALGAGETYEVHAQQTGVPCSGRIPATASSLALNVTALDATARTFLTLWGGGDRPLASSLNPAPGQPPTPNAVTVDLTDAQSFSVYNHAGSVSVIIDVVGYYADHHHDDRYAPRAEMASTMEATLDERLGTSLDERIDQRIDASVGGGANETVTALVARIEELETRLANLSGEDLADGSIRMSKLKGLQGMRRAPLVIVERNECARVGLNDHLSATYVGGIVRGKVLGPGGTPVDIDGLVVMPTIVQDSGGTHHSAELVVCNFGQATVKLSNDMTIEYWVVRS